MHSEQFYNIIFFRIIGRVVLLVLFFYRVMLRLKLEDLVKQVLEATITHLKVWTHRWKNTWNLIAWMVDA